MRADASDFSAAGAPASAGVHATVTSTGPSRDAARDLFDSSSVSRSPVRLGSYSPRTEYGARVGRCARMWQCITCRRPRALNSMRLVETRNFASRDKLLQGTALFFIGVSCFAVPETIFLQTPMFDLGFEFGEAFYGLAMLFLFLPGLLMQFLQGALDEKFDAKFGTARATLARVLVGHTLQATALFFFLGMLQCYPEWYGTRKSTALLGCTLTCIGLGSAVVYGSCSQVNSMFDSSLHPFFFAGTFCVSLCMAPVNLAIGGLMNCMTYAVSWRAVWTFYSVAMLLNIAGITGVALLCNQPAGRREFLKKDVLISPRARARKQDHPEERAEEGDRSEQRRLLTVGGEENSPYGRHASLSAGRRGSLTGSLNLGVPHSVNTPPRARLAAQPSSLAGSPARGVVKEKLTTCAIVRASAPAGFTMVLSLVESLLVCSQYSRLTPRDLQALPTIMFYSYYTSQCGGTLLNMIPGVKKYSPLWLLFLLTVLRLCGVFYIFCYNDGTLTAAMPSDYTVVYTFTLYMFVGGYTFSASYSQGSARFENLADRTYAASILNIEYYLGICIGSLIVLLRWMHVFVEDVMQHKCDGC